MKTAIEDYTIFAGGLIREVYQRHLAGGYLHSVRVIASNPVIEIIERRIWEMLDEEVDHLLEEVSFR